VTRREQIWR
jgi:hypothetical protein